MAFLTNVFLFAIFFSSSTATFELFFRHLSDKLSSVVMGDLFLGIPNRLHCLGAGRDFTYFQLFSRIHPDKHSLLEPGNLRMLSNSDYDPSLPTKVIIHGFIDNQDLSDWMQKMKQALLTEGDYNVIIADWGCGNGFPYLQAIQNSKIAGQRLRDLILFLGDASGADPASFHLIGHSLGAHIAAVAGHGVPHLGRISALDPAGPMFYTAPLSDRLDPTDALFVDVIHTDGGQGLLEGLGLHTHQGHADFYPNGGKTQPGCNSSPFAILPRIGLNRAARYYITCDHFRSVDYYIDSISNGLPDRCEPVAVACRDWDTYEQGRCADCSDLDECAPMGFFSDAYLGRNPNGGKKEFYVKTAADEPYCLHQYQVIVETGCNRSYCVDPISLRPGYEPGVIQLELTNLDGKLAKINLKEKTNKMMKPGGQYAYLVTTRFPVGEVETAKVWWSYASPPETPTKTSPGLSFRKIQVHPISLYDETARSSDSPRVTVLCGNNDETLGNDQVMELSINTC